MIGQTAGVDGGETLLQPVTSTVSIVSVQRGLDTEVVGFMIGGLLCGLDLRILGASSIDVAHVLFRGVGSCLNGAQLALVRIEEHQSRQDRRGARETGDSLDLETREHHALGSAWTDALKSARRFWAAW